MPQLTVLDKLVVDVLMDNSSDSYSSKPANVDAEFNNVIAAGAHEISGKTLCCAQLGLSLMMTATVSGVRHKMLFDAGPEGELLIRNAKNLGIAWDDVEEIGVSHGHWDHMGALIAVLDAMTGAGRKAIPCHVNPGMFVERGARLTTGRVVPFEKVPSIDELNSHGAACVSDPKARTLLNGWFYLSGEIPRVTDFEKGRQDHLSRSDENADWQPDPFLMDERYLAAHIKDKGLVVFSSCSHAGVVNVLHDVRSNFPEIPIYAVFGGLHLVGSLEAIIPKTVESMKEFNLKHIVPAHCTGWRAVHALVSAFGETVVVPSAVGSRYAF
jgi:7,8-dihydropterin-6-yl-methyl-4-(beta-D-ribofuranosyl)aminobenzene 5'-phosphate synthase